MDQNLWWQQNSQWGLDPTTAGTNFLPDSLCGEGLTANTVVMEERMTPAEYTAWKELRKMGRLRYVLRHGIVAKGLLFATVMAVGQWAWAAVKHGHLSLGESAARFVFMTVLYGGIVGWMDYSAAEDRYREGWEADDPEAAVECLKCGEVIPQGETRCQACGWSFEDDSPASEML
ncbi:MAG: hypothetical protein JWO89_2659 [Verrucomicrobiaceae bacterium]|nr:hypothetical protein [Verrucomicrobiaceae bacterium]